MAIGGLGMDFFTAAAFFFFLPWLSNVSKGPAGTERSQRSVPSGARRWPSCVVAGVSAAQ
jgi:hypothetical protein